MLSGKSAASEFRERDSLLAPKLIARKRSARLMTRLCHTVTICAIVSRKIPSIHHYTLRDAGCTGVRFANIVEADVLTRRKLRGELLPSEREAATTTHHRLRDRPYQSGLTMYLRNGPTAHRREDLLLAAPRHDTRDRVTKRGFARAARHVARTGRTDRHGRHDIATRLKR